VRDGNELSAAAMMKKGANILFYTNGNDFSAMCPLMIH
jgi:hypothetical protein